jgi:hypothetical protein
MIKQRMVRWAKHAAQTGNMRQASKIWALKSKRKKTLAGLRSRWVDNIMIYFEELTYESVFWFHVAQDREQWRAL